MPDLIAVLIIGLLGSAHCVGMCGGFVLALSQVKGQTRRLQAHQALYYLGKTATYAALGALVGGFGNVLMNLFSGMQQVLSIGLGVFLVVVGLGLIGVWKRFVGPRFMARWKPLSAAIGKVLQRRSHSASFGLGLLNGLLPCGLVYGVLAVAAASGTPLRGTVVMAVFGLSTIPALYLLAGTGFLMRPLWRKRVSVISGVLVVVLGIITIARGTPVMQVFHGDHEDHQEQVDHSSHK